MEKTGAGRFFLRGVERQRRKTVQRGTAPNRTVAFLICENRTVGFLISENRTEPHRRRYHSTERHRRIYNISEHCTEPHHKISDFLIPHRTGP